FPFSSRAVYVGSVVKLTMTSAARASSRGRTSTWVACRALAADAGEGERPRARTIAAKRAPRRSQGAHTGHPPHRVSSDRALVRGGFGKKELISAPSGTEGERLPRHSGLSRKRTLREPERTNNGRNLPARSTEERPALVPARCAAE